MSALQKPEEEDLNIEKLELVVGRLATTILYFPGVSVDFCTYMRVLFTYMRALYIICLIAIMPHPLLTLVFEPLVITINCPVYPSPPTPFLLLRCSTEAYGTIGTCLDNELPVLTRIISSVSQLNDSFS